MNNAVKDMRFVIGVTMVACMLLAIGMIARLHEPPVLKNYHFGVATVFVLLGLLLIRAAVKEPGRKFSIDVNFFAAGCLSGLIMVSWAVHMVVRLWLMNPVAHLSPREGREIGLFVILMTVTSAFFLLGIRAIETRNERG